MSLTICPTCYKLKNQNDEWIEIDFDPETEDGPHVAKELCPDHRTETLLVPITFLQRDHQYDELIPTDNSDEVSKHMIGDDYTQWMAAPGTGKITYRITRIDGQGVWGIETNNTARILEPHEVI